MVEAKSQHHAITPENVTHMLSVQPPSFHERADLLLQLFEKQTGYAGEFINRDNSWVAVSYCVNIAELDEIIGFLETCGHVVQGTASRIHSLKVCPDGWARLEEVKEINPDSQQCFVAMWFDAGMQHVYETVIAEAISNAGYSPHRVDQREHNDKIDDEIIAQIRKSRFVLAGFTGHRGGVYYEAGFAKGLGLEVIWTCREDDIDNLHFDIRQFNCIIWKDEDSEDFKKKIQNRIEAVIGVGNA